MLSKDCLDRIYADYGKVTNSRVSETLAYQREIRRYFDPSDNTAYEDLANSAGAIYVGELADFMTASLYPADGSWLEANISPAAPVEVQQSLSAVTEHMRNTLAKSNFYGKVNELIINGLLYNKGLMSVDYDNGLSFNVYDTENTYVSSDTNESVMRTYSHQMVTAADLNSLFTNAPKEAESAEKEEHAPERTYKLIYAIVPNKPLWTKGLNISEEYKFVKLHLLKDYESTDPMILLKPRTGFDACGYKHTPMLQYKTGQKQSLCKRALPDAVIINDYEKKMLERADIANYPAMAVPAELEARGSYDLGPNGIVPVAPGETPPQPISTTLDLNISEHTVARKEARLREMFKVDMIRQASMIGVSQYEHHGMKYNALKAIQPLACLLTSRTTEALLQRVHTLLKENDDMYAQMMAEVPEEMQGAFFFDNLKRMMQKSNRLANMGRAAQAIQAYASFNPQSVQILNSEGAVIQALIDSDLPHLVKSQQEVAAEREGFAQAAQQQEQQEMAMEQQKLQPQMQKNEIEAAKVAMEQGGGETT